MENRKLTAKMELSYGCRSIGILLLAISMTVAMACAKGSNSEVGVPTQAPTPAPTTSVVGPTPSQLIQASPGAATVQLVTLPSVRLKRDMKYNAVLPAGYKDNLSQRYAVIYLLHGLTGHYNDWTDRTSLPTLAGKYSFIIITPEGNDGWYTDSSRTSEQYESYIISELIPDVDRRFRTLFDREHRIIAGLSMGGYGAIKFGLKYPDKFSLVGSFSGAFGITRWSENTSGNKTIGRSVDIVFGPLGSGDRDQNDVFRMARAILPAQAQQLPYIYMSCGLQDTTMLKLNNEFEALLAEKHIQHEYHPSSGIHDWTFWGKEIETFLDLVNGRSKIAGI